MHGFVSYQINNLTQWKKKYRTKIMFPLWKNKSHILFPKKKTSSASLFIYLGYTIGKLEDKNNLVLGN